MENLVYKCRDLIQESDLDIDSISIENDGRFIYYGISNSIFPSDLESLHKYLEKYYEEGEVLLFSSINVRDNKLYICVEIDTNLTGTDLYILLKDNGLQIYI